MAWDDILGQSLAKQVLQTHLADGRVAGAYLLVGPDGVGKRRLAMEMARALNCVGSGARPCDACLVCSQIGRGVHPDVHLLLPGGPADQIKIDDVRHLLGRIALRPFSAATQVAVIDGAERLTEEAANGLLKALEEPSARTRFLLTTVRFTRCLPTIVSRCQVIRCAPLSSDAVKRILVEQQGCEVAIAEAVARLAGGSASRAIELASRWAAHQQLCAHLANDAPSAWLEQPLPETREGVAQLVDGMTAWLRDLAVTAAADADRAVHAGHADALRRQALAVDLDQCLSTAVELMALRESLEQFVSPRLVASLAREKWLALNLEAGS